MHNYCDISSLKNVIAYSPNTLNYVSDLDLSLEFTDLSVVRVRNLNCCGT